MINGKEGLAFTKNHLGPEPEVSGIVLSSSSVEYSKILNWYHAICGVEQARKYLIEFFQDNPDIYQNAEFRFTKVPDSWVNPTAAWQARIISRGGILGDSSIDFFNEQIEKMLQHGDDIVEEKQTTKKLVSVQDHIRDKASELVAEIEGMIDDGIVTSDWSVYDYLKSNEISTTVAKHLVRHFEPVASELVDAVTGDDEKLKEGYSRISEEDLIDIAAIYQTLLEDTQRYCGENKTVRKARTKKAVTPEKLLRHLKYLERYDDYNLTSVSSKKIIGAQELWTFNPKTSVLAVYRATGTSGLTVNRTYIDKYDDKTSIAKRIGRHTEERIQAVLNGGKVALRKIMDSINGNELEVPRINEFTILLRVITN